ncbi:MAG: NAD(P)H-hydrate dehydratase [Verrucomicrobiae bacterium]|nr:NAD(P)H-hydrate dehydratase [Verrucomicrobiae bacterium]NNJ42809.1 NAD(P)H-hydrate dehydratase [Akkermansiaceae bacterium]
MGCLTCKEMQRLEEVAFNEGVTAEALMEKAGLGIAQAILRRYPDFTRSPVAIACIGSGNNGGDALVALRHLEKAGWKVGVKCQHALSRLGVLPRKKWRELDGVLTEDPESQRDRGCPLILLDGLLGIGGHGPLRPPLDELATWMHHIRDDDGAEVIAMDIPSGVDGDTGAACDHAVVADLTLTVGVPKVGLFSELAVNYTGAIECVPLAELPVPDAPDSPDALAASRPYLNDVHSLRGLLPRRPHDFHKGDAGRVGIVAGSRGMLGAAVLCAQGAMRAGAGLVTLFIDEDLYPLLVPMMPPEVMLRPVSRLQEIHEVELDVLAVGPGMGRGDADSRKDFFDLLKRFDRPVVLDADGLNRIASDGVENHIGPHMTLTPHPGEMARLFPDGAGMSRLEACRAFASRYAGTTVLLKGARSLIVEDGSPSYVNGTGHAGMASGGQGDVLTGVIASLLGQGVRQLDAARLGAWLCGRAAEFALSHGGASMQSISAGDVPNWLGRAFREL